MNLSLYFWPQIINLNFKIYEGKKEGTKSNQRSEMIRFKEKRKKNP